MKHLRSAERAHRDASELSAPPNPLYDAGEYADAGDRGRQLVAAHPQYGGSLYNLAGCVGSKVLG